MDQPDTDHERSLQQLKEQLSEACVDFSEPGTEAFYESIAVCEEDALNTFLEKGSSSIL